MVVSSSRLIEFGFWLRIRIGRLVIVVMNSIVI